MKTCLFGLVLLLVALPAFALDLPSERERWISLHVDELDVFSNTSESATTAIARQLLQMRAAIGQVTHLKVRSPLRTRVYIFAGERGFAPFRDAVMQRKGAHVTGAYLGTDDGNFILIQADAAGGVDRVVFHELTHYFVRNTLSGLPLWFNEGIAEYYSTFTTSGSDVNIGKPVPEHVLWLREQRLIPLRELFATDAQSPTYNEGTRQGVFYAESWAVVHYLMMGNPKRKEQFVAFLHLLDGQKPLDDAFRGAFNASYDELEAEIRNYIHKYSFSYMRYSGADLHLTEVPKPTPMTRGDVLGQLGHLLAWSGPANRDSGKQFLLDAVKADDTNAAAHADLGRIDAFMGRSAEATQELDRAVQLGSSDAAVYLIYGATLADRIAEARATPAAGDVARMRQLFQRSVELDPSLARGWAGLGVSYVLSDDDPAPGIAALEKSLALSPAQKDVARSLVELYVRAGRRDDAVRIVVTRIVPTGDRDLVAHAWERILLIDVRKVESLVAANKIDEALPIARSVIAQTSDERLKAHLQKLMDLSAEQQAVEAQASSLDDAVAKANAGKFAEAIAIVDGLLPKLTDPKAIEWARKFRGEVAERQASLDVSSSIRRALEKVDAGKYDEALALIDRVLPNIKDPDILAQTRKFRDDVVKRKRAAANRSATHR